MAARSRLVVLLVACAACGGGAPRPRSRHPAPPETSATASPLVGLTWDVAARRAIDRDALVARLVAARVVLLGETHDNPRHHAGQAELLGAMIAAGRRPVVAFEMIQVDQQEAVDAALHAGPRDADAVARAVAWEQSGWPAFPLYRPLVAAALDAGLAVRGANVPRAQVRALAREGLAGIEPARATALGIDRPIAPDQQAALEAEMAESHCGMLPAEMLGGMVLAQRARDAQIAEVLAGAGESGAVGIAGAGHARIDRGVPARLRELAPDATVVALAFLEAEPSDTAPPADLPYDIAIFTTPEPREDPCLAFRGSGSPGAPRTPPASRR